ncbi:hypothetical protein MuYL_3093 [Mucilaginibacter xinganensis]|uniref:Uncharacterized protein n=1 Tax=Mucilaginibacter xinganensis TaxID=1234841 RepID=A0A223NZH1_9SPHI|nr:hypothetical protein MuYL_3093 [Mucilaginibacter xinganensis]
MNLALQYFNNGKPATGRLYLQHRSCALVKKLQTKIKIRSYFPVLNFASCGHSYYPSNHSTFLFTRYTWQTFAGRTITIQSTSISAAFL